jgi:exopolysaccharide biosynthesis protein
VIADLKEKDLNFAADTTSGRRFTPSQFFIKNDQPVVLVNCTFFSFETNRNLNLVINNGRVLSYNTNHIAGRGKDTISYHHVMGSAIGISKKRKADVAWLYTDSTLKHAYAVQSPELVGFKDSAAKWNLTHARQTTSKKNNNDAALEKWKMRTAVGGGPVLLQNGMVEITNNQERKFGGKAINDKHPRTAMGYTSDNKLIILVVQGRFPGTAEGASLVHMAEMLKDLGCKEALNLDGGGSSCLLINGKETIAPSDKVQRSVPAVFMIKRK